MDRVSGWYKRRAQWVTLGLAVILTIALNVSALRIAEQLSAEPTVRAAVVAKSEAAAEKSGDEGAEGLKQAGEDVESAVDDLAALDLPVFWIGEAVPQGGEEILTTVFGWLITILAISLGAPFWFDALGKLSNLRMAGKKPEERPAAGA